MFFFFVTLCWQTARWSGNRTLLAWLRLTTKILKLSAPCVQGRGNTDPRGKRLRTPRERGGGVICHCSTTRQQQEGHTQLLLPTSISRAPLIALMINCGRRVYFCSSRAQRASAPNPKSTLTFALLKGCCSCSFSLFWQSAKLTDIITACTA